MENENQEVQPKAKKQPKAESKPVDPANYAKFTNLKFLSLSGAKLKDEVTKEMNDLESELKTCAGKIPVRTVRAAIRNEQVLIVQGVPVTKEIEQLIIEAKAENYYFGE